MPTEEAPTCPLCSVSTSLVFADVLDYRYDDTPRDRFDVYRCVRCRLYVTDVGDVDLGPYYPDDYRAHGIRDDEDRSLVERFHDSYLQWSGRRFGIDVLDAVTRIGPGRRVLDVGCGSGGLLARLDERGHDVVGCDVSSNAARNAADAYGLAVDVGRLPEVGYDREEFDVVVYNHSFEHVGRPCEYARETARVCKVGGYVVVNVPNVRSVERAAFGRYWTDLDVPRHVYHWNPGALNRLLGAEGFELQERRFTSSPRVLSHSLNRMIEEAAGFSSPTPAVFDPVSLPVSLLSGALGRSGRFVSVYRLNDE